MTSPPAAISRPLPDLTTLRQAVDRGDTRPEGWRRRQLEALANLIETHEQEILHALADDLGKPELEGWWRSWPCVTN
jgi:NAD-dependent aldehyde dehydrogenases